MLWTQNGGFSTESELQQLSEDEISSILNWMKNLPLRYEVSKYGFSHSGWWGDEKGDYGEDKILWNREWTIDKRISPTNTDKIMFFGHTPVPEPEKIGENCYDIDTGCVFGNKLTAAIIEKNTITTISVNTN